MNLYDMKALLDAAADLDGNAQIEHVGLCGPSGYYKNLRAYLFFGMDDVRYGLPNGRLVKSSELEQSGRFDYGEIP